LDPTYRNIKPIITRTEGVWSNNCYCLLQEDIEFDDSYVNPCWAETIPRFPYANNSYLRVSAQARELEPEFQLMRKRFASRQDPATKWRLRCLPSFYIMETPPEATPSLSTVLSYHPDVVMPKLPEPEYWNLKGPGMKRFSAVDYHSKCSAFAALH
jgi:hypothetical protein